MVLDIPREGGPAKGTGSVSRQGSALEAVGKVHKRLREWWCGDADLKDRGDDWAFQIFREHDKEADARAEQGARGLKNEDATSFGQM